MGRSKVAYLIKRYWAVTFFPGATAASIYADWNHTRLWKKELAKREQELQLNI